MPGVRAAAAPPEFTGPAPVKHSCGVSPSVEPTFHNLYAKSNRSGEFTMVNDLRARRLQTPAMQDALKRTNGDLNPITDVPDAVYETVRFIPPQRPVEAADRRGPVGWTGAPGQLHPDWFGPGLISWRMQSLFQTAASRLLATPTLGMGPGAADCGQCARDRHVVGGVAGADAAGILAEGHAGRRRRPPHSGLVIDESDCGQVSINDSEWDSCRDLCSKPGRTIRSGGFCFCHDNPGPQSCGGRKPRDPIATATPPRRHPPDRAEPRRLAGHPRLMPRQQPHRD